MKSLSQFLISEELPVDDIEGRTRTGRAEKKYKKKTRKTLSAADRARLDAARLAEIEKDALGKRGEEIRKSVVKSQGQDDLLDTINKNRQRPVKKGEKFYGKPTGVDVKTGKAKYVPPKEIEGRDKYTEPQRKLDSKGKPIRGYRGASEEGIKSYINKARQMRTGSNVPVDSKTTDSIAKFSKSEYEKKINQKYGGRRAKRARSNAPSFDEVQRKINKAEYAKNLKKQRSSDFRKFSAKADKLAKETARRSAETTRSDAFNRLYGTDGGYGDSNTGSGASTQSKGSQTPPKTPKTNTIKIDSKYTAPKTSTPSIKLSTPIKIDSKYTPPKTSTPSIKIDTPKTKPEIKIDSKYTPPKRSTPSIKVDTPKKTFNQFSNQATKQTSLFPELEKPPKTKTQGFRANPTPDDVIKQPRNYNPDQGVLDFDKKTKANTPPKKSLKDFLKNAVKSKALRKGAMRTAKGVSKAAPIVTGTLNAIGNYKAARAQGRSKFSSAVKSAVTTAAYIGGATAGGTLGTGAGAITGPGALVTGTAVAVAGGQIASTLTSKAYDAVFKPPTKKKVKTTPNTNSSGVLGGGGKKGGYKWKPTGIAIES